MANNTPEWWDIDGVSLHQYGWSITTIGGNRLNLPPRRGENLVLGSAAGAVWRPKHADQRTITLAMFLTGMDPATGDATGDETLRWNDSWDQLRRLVWRIDSRQFVLRRRQRLTISGTPTILVTEGLAEMTGTMEPTMNGRTRADFALDLLMADPYFYGTLLGQSLAINTPASVVNPGMDVAAQQHLVVELFGPLTNPVLTNASTDPDVWVRYTGSIAAGQRLRLSVPQYEATLLTPVTNGTTATNVVNDVSFGGGRRWMELVNGPNLLTLTGSGTGHAEVRFRPPYI